MTMRRFRPFLVAIAVLLVATSCVYLNGATSAEQSGGEVPWWCTATEEIPVTEGPAVGTVNWYAGTHKSDLSWERCKTMSAQFDVAKAYAERWPTLGAAEADGWRSITT